MRTKVAAVVMLTAIATLAIADDGVFEGSGGTIALSKTDNVRMVAEEVAFDLSEPHMIRVSCLFVVENEGPDDRLLLGFPDYWPDPNDDSHRADGQSAIRDLRITVDGLPVETAAVPVSVAPDEIRAAFGGVVSYNCAHVWNCTFARGQTRILRTDYSQPYSAESDGSRIINYVLRTGASWKGPIGQAVLRIKRGDMRMKWSAYPSGWVLVGDEYVWSGSDLEPDSDVSVGMADPREVARWLVNTWRWATQSPNGPGLDSARKSVCEHISFARLGREFLGEVCDALGDTVPDLRSYLEAQIAALRE